MAKEEKMERDKRETRMDEILGRLNQIDQALLNVGHTADSLRRERTRLWDEYHGLLAEELDAKRKREEPGIVFG